MWQFPSITKQERRSRPQSTPPPRSTLNEVLRLNAFRAGGKDDPTPTPSCVEPGDKGAHLLNNDLRVIAEFFPDVQYEVLRKVLQKYDGDSRLEVALWQIHKHKAQWARGRLQEPPRDRLETVPLIEQFRTEQYKTASKRLLYREFSVLSASSVDAILAEVNYSYTRARPLLSEIAAKSWRATLQSIFRRKKAVVGPPSFLKGSHDALAEITGDGELEIEVEELFHVSLSSIGATTPRVATQTSAGKTVDAEDLFECQVCYNDVPFMQIVACTTENHFVCSSCLTSTLSEALFGQGFEKVVDPALSTLRCVAPCSRPCTGHIPPLHLQQRLSTRPNGLDLWTKLQYRLAEYALVQSSLPLVRCPFCSYAEIEHRYDATTACTLKWRFRRFSITTTIVLILLAEFILPAGLLLVMLSYTLYCTVLYRPFYTSLANIANTQATTRFTCHNPCCSKASCLKCSKRWHDPHVCHESLTLSLRQTVEAARTAAVKRVCPRCQTAFVKSSGCNKLVCPCGYVMCYLCRRNIGSPKLGEHGFEGYRHFCEHFRPRGGACTQCEKCELYKDEDEDAAAKVAGEQAEREWRAQQTNDGKDVGDIKVGGGSEPGSLEAFWIGFRSGQWNMQRLIDGLVRTLIVVDV